MDHHIHKYILPLLLYRIEHITAKFFLSEQTCQDRKIWQEGAWSILQEYLDTFHPDTSKARNAYDLMPGK